MKKFFKAILQIFFWILNTIFVLAVLIVIAIALINMHVLSSTDDFIYPSSEEILEAQAEETYDAIVVLGTSVYGRDPSPMLVERLEQGISLYNDGLAPIIIMSGHTEEYYDEVGVMEEYAVSRNVPAENIIQDTHGYSTYDSMLRLSDVYNVDRVIIVSQEFHIPRAVYLARALDIDASAVSADTENTEVSANVLFREILARVKDFAYAHLQPAID